MGEVCCYMLVSWMDLTPRKAPSPEVDGLACHSMEDEGLSNVFAAFPRLSTIGLHCTMPTIQLFLPKTNTSERISDISKQSKHSMAERQKSLGIASPTENLDQQKRSASKSYHIFHKHNSTSKSPACVGTVPSTQHEDSVPNPNNLFDIKLWVFESL